jgi:hypothetical protein
VSLYLFNARRNLTIPETETLITGVVIAASAVSAVDLQRRTKKFHEYEHFKRRLLDPQLYMASLDPALDQKTTEKLAAYPWFHGDSVPKFSSGEYGTPTKWKQVHQEALVSKWTRTIPSDPAAIKKAVEAAVQYQQNIGCESILLAGPLTTIEDQSAEVEIAWIRAGIEACQKLGVNAPVCATVALSEAVLHAAPLKNPIIHSLSNYISSRAELAGAYLIIEQSDSAKYFWDAKDPLMACLVLIDDLHRGAKKKVILNYLGTFGVVASAVGADIWSSGYFLMQRRFCRVATTGRAYPRYHSFPLAGDIGLKEDLDSINKRGLLSEVITPTNADKNLRAAFERKLRVENVPQWKHTMNNCAAAQAHYLQVAAAAANALAEKSPEERREWVHSWLKSAVELVKKLESQKLVTSASDIRHQKVWLEVFQQWRDYARQ